MCGKRWRGEVGRQVLEASEGQRGQETVQQAVQRVPGQMMCNP